ncbi:MAG: DNA mismatch repair endonuclease MutL [Candidatus Caenarcaniphilales bacterium]|nr:DNA mismatch repair endonuclease MutL [Candidatus Caenarcaniphilales bacterium]
MLESQTTTAKFRKAEIKPLSRQLVNQIAAGEVIERPASAVKELVDNAIDAGAHKIQVHILSSDARSFRVVDDGSGIPLDQLDLAFTAHATSKISSLDDLNLVSTMGFRGEALASILSVAMVTCESKHFEASEAYKATFDHQGSKEISPSHLSQGTALEVLDLFGNVPVRLKFMKKPETETQLVVDIVRELALANPAIAFELIAGKKLVFRTTGSGHWEQVAQEVFPDQLNFKYVEVSRADPYIELQGLIAPLSEAKTHRRNQITLVNRRPVKCQVLQKAIKDVYHGFLPAQKYPSLLLSLFLSPEDLDVNVHPTKREVRYTRPDLVYKLVMVALEKHLIIGSSLGDTPVHKDDPLSISARDFRNTEAQTLIETDKPFTELKPQEHFPQGQLIEREHFPPLFHQETSTIFKPTESTVRSAHPSLTQNGQNSTSEFINKEHKLIRGLELELKKVDHSDKTKTFLTHLGARSEFCLQKGCLVLSGAVSGEKEICESLVSRLNDWLFELDLKGIEEGKDPLEQIRFLPKTPCAYRPRPSMSILEKIWERDHWACVYCGKALLHPVLVRKALRHDPESWVEWLGSDGKTHRRHILREHQAMHDHYLPYQHHPSLAKSADQLLAVCRTCNQAKSDSTDYQNWKPQKFNPWESPQKIGTLVFKSPKADGEFEHG